MDTELSINLVLLISSYIYILSIILITGKIRNRLPKNFSRKLLHIMIGNFIFLIPFFSYNTFPMNFPFFVAAPFILLTFLVSPFSPIKSLSSRLSGLADITSGGHKLGLILYAISYTLLALFFSDRPYVIATGIIPLAYGDAAASLVGQKIGHHQYKIFSKKSLEGSITLFLVSFFGLLGSLMFFSFFYNFSVINFIAIYLVVALTATFCEALTPKGFDNLTIPLLSALVFLIMIGGI